SPNTVEAAVQRVLARVPRARLVATQEVLSELATELGADNDPLDEPTHPSLEEERPGQEDDDETGAGPPPPAWERSRMRAAR
ncbi:MAG: hypothetical protein ACXU86_23390, partial [Archangium sp.]